MQAKGANYNSANVRITEFTLDETPTMWDEVDEQGLYSRPFKSVTLPLEVLKKICLNSEEIYDGICEFAQPKISDSE